MVACLLTKHTPEYSDNIKPNSFYVLTLGSLPNKDADSTHPDIEDRKVFSSWPDQLLTRRTSLTNHPDPAHVFIWKSMGIFHFLSPKTLAVIGQIGFTLRKFPWEMGELMKSYSYTLPGMRFEQDHFWSSITHLLSANDSSRKGYHIPFASARAGVDSLSRTVRTAEEVAQHSVHFLFVSLTFANHSKKFRNLSV
jgi:hypothetical protein